MVSDVHGSADDARSRRRRRRRADLPRRPRALPRLRRRHAGHLRRPVRRPRTPRRFVELRTAGPLRRGPRLDRRPVGRGRRSARAATGTRSLERQGARSSTPSCSPPCRHRRTSPTATSTCPRSGRTTCARGTRCSTARSSSIDGLRVRLRRGRPGEPDAHAVRARRGGVRRQGRRARRGRRALRAHPAGACPELCYDVVARRFELGSRAILEHVRETQPAHGALRARAPAARAPRADRAHGVRQRRALPRRQDAVLALVVTRAIPDRSR